MNIKIDENLRITTDKYNYIIQEKVVAKSGKTKGKVKWKPRGYYTRIDHLCNALLNIRIRKADVSSLSGLAECIKKEIRYIGDLCNIKVSIAFEEK